MAVSTHEMMDLAPCLADRTFSVNIFIIICVSVHYGQYLIDSQLHVTVVIALGQIFLVLSPSKHNLIVVFGPFGVGKSHVTVCAGCPRFYHLPVPVWPHILSALPSASSPRLLALRQGWRNAVPLGDTQFLGSKEPGFLFTHTQPFAPRPLPPGTACDTHNITRAFWIAAAWCCSFYGALPR